MPRKLLSGFILVAAAAGLGLYLSRGPWMAYADQKHKADAATHEMVKSEQQKRDLLIQQAKVESPMGREEIARDHGYLKTGEQPMTPSHP